MRLEVKTLLGAVALAIVAVPFAAHTALRAPARHLTPASSSLKFTVIDPYPSLTLRVQGFAAGASAGVIAGEYSLFAPPVLSAPTKPGKALGAAWPELAPQAEWPKGVPEASLPKAHPSQPTPPAAVHPKTAAREASAAPVERLPALQLPKVQALELPRPRPSQAAPKQPTPGWAWIEFDAPTLAPMGHTHFCLQYPDDCRVRKIVFRGGPIALTEKRRAQLVRVNAQVNRAIRPMRMNESIADEKWLISPKVGDCNDYAVTKRHDLLALGWPARDLLLAEVVTGWGEHHLVLVVRTSTGDLVADSLSKQIRNWSKAPYQWVRVESPSNPLYWETVKTPAPDVVAMADHDDQL